MTETNKNYTQSEAEAILREHYGDSFDSIFGSDYKVEESFTVLMNTVDASVIGYKKHGPLTKKELEQNVLYWQNLCNLYHDEMGDLLKGTLPGGMTGELKEKMLGMWQRKPANVVRVTDDCYPILCKHLLKVVKQALKVARSELAYNQKLLRLQEQMTNNHNRFGGPNGNGGTAGGGMVV